MTKIEKESVTVLKKLRDAYYKCEQDSEMKDVARLIVASALDVAIAALERDRWISVEERLPELNTSVLVHGIGNTDGFWGEQVTAISKRFLFKIFPSSEGEETWSSPWQYFHTDYKITHWMPLPEPPKDDNK